METDETRLKRELVAAEALDDGGREAALAQGRLAKHLREKGPSRLADAEEAYSNWVKKLQSEIDGRRAGTDAELRESILDYIVVLEEQDKDSSNPMFELLRVDKRVFGNEAPEYGDDMERVGLYLASQQSYGQAEHLLKRALAMKEKNSGKDHPEAAGILRAIGRVLFEMKALKDAGDAFDRALAIDNRGDSPADVIEDMRSLGMVYCRQGIYEKAEVMYRKVVEMDRKFRGGEEDPSVITEMNVHAVLLYAQGKMDQAEPLLRRVLALREKVLGHDHVDAAESLVNLAVLNNRKGMYDEALPRLNRALGILRQAHGDLHPETVACWSWIAETHQKQGQYAESEEILMQVVALNRQILGDDHPGVADSLSDLAELRRAQGKLDEAEDSHLEALRIREDYFGPDHDTVAQSAQMLSLLLQSSGREDEAQEYGKRVVRIREKVHEAGVRYASSRNNVAATPQEHGENARRNHARVAVEKSITRLR